jgi:hypothetical protein
VSASAKHLNDVVSFVCLPVSIYRTLVGDTIPREVMFLHFNTKRAVIKSFRKER